MTVYDAIILGIVQGITEFLPISSSGHLVIAQALLGINMPGNVLEVITHIGTLFSVIFVFWKELISIFKTIQNSATKIYILFLFIGTIPAIVIGLGGKNIISGFFDSIYVVGGALLFTGIILLTTQKLSLKDNQLNWKKRIFISVSNTCYFRSRFIDSFGFERWTYFNPNNTINGCFYQFIFSWVYFFKMVIRFIRKW